MADGSIVYEVRVDSSNIDADLTRAGSLLERGTQEINRLATNTAQVFGRMLGEVFGGSAAHAEQAVSKLGSSLDKLKNTAAPLLNALTPISRELEKISKLSAGTASEGSTAKIGSAKANNDTKSVAHTLTKMGFPSFSVGTSYIPYDDFPALLHKGEAVLTASENAALKAAGGIGAVHGAQGDSQPVIMQNNANNFADFNNKPVEVTLKIGEYEFTQIIADTMNNLYRQWGKSPLK
ncbi:MAG: hypothetical protein FWE74_10770 [Oscillospiraceae bacterium]|nr:hypothetical protein [Oscillospiraceae bacterium]